MVLEYAKNVKGKLLLWIPGQNKKDLVAAYLLSKAEQEGKLKPGMCVVEVSTGNMAVSIGKECVRRGYDCLVYTSKHRKNEIPAQVRVIETSLKLTENGAQDKDGNTS